MRRKWMGWLLFLGLLAGAWWVFRWWFAPAPVPVRVVPVERGVVEWTATNSNAGTIKARTRAGISPEVAGIVRTIRFRDGETVEAGATLIELDDETQSARLLQAQRTLERADRSERQARIDLERARRELERNRGLARDDLVSDDVLDELESRAERLEAHRQVLEAERELAAAGVAVAQAEWNKTRVRAPFSGRVAELNVEVGEWVTPAPPLVPAPAALDLFDPASLCISAPMDEVDSGRLRVGQAVRVTIDSHPDQVFPGTVTTVAAYVLDVEAQNRTVEIEVDLEDPALARSLRPGTSADVEVILERREGVLRIPAQALLEGGRVLVVRDGVLEERAVTTGRRNWEYAEIREGLEDGEPVVLTVDRKEVAPGATVVIQPGPDEGRAARVP